jgi:hypothetical protein
MAHAHVYLLGQQSCALMHVGTTCACVLQVTVQDAATASPVTWSRSTASGVELRVQLDANGTLSYALAVDNNSSNTSKGAPWLVSSPSVSRPRVWCHGRWHNFSGPLDTFAQASTVDSFSVVYTSAAAITAAHVNNGTGTTRSGARDTSSKGNRDSHESAAVVMNVTFELLPDGISFGFRSTFPGL